MVSEETEASIGEIKSDVKDIKEKIHSIDITMAKNTQSLEEHMAQTNLLRQMVLPLHEERIARVAVDEYKKNAFFTRNKIIATVITVLTFIGMIIFKLMGK